MDDFSSRVEKRIMSQGDCDDVLLVNDLYQEIQRLRASRSEVIGRGPMDEAKIEIVERLGAARDYLRTPKITIVGPVQEIELRHALAAQEAALTIQSLVKALEIAEGVLSNVPYEFETTNGGRIPVTKASAARDLARSVLSKLRGSS